MDGAKFLTILRWTRLIGWIVVLMILAIVGIFAIQVKLVVLLFKHWR